MRGEDLRAVMRRFPSGGRRRHGRRRRAAGRPDRRVVDDALPGAAPGRRLHREAGGAARADPRGGRVLGLAARGRAGGDRAAFRARRTADRDVDRRRGRAGRRPPLRPRCGRLVPLHPSAPRPTPARTRSSPARSTRRSPAPPRRPLLRLDGDSPVAVIQAVVFDLDGVLLDSEQVWDEVREALVRERGGRWPDHAQARMMGMSSPEWSRYLHDEAGLDRAAGGDQRGGRRADAGALPRPPAAIPGALDAVGRLAAAACSRLLSWSNRPLIGRSSTPPTSPSCSRRPSPPRRSRPGSQLPTSSSRRRAGSASSDGLRRGRGLGQRLAGGGRCGHARRRDADPHYPPAPETLALAAHVLDSLDELTPELLASRGARHFSACSLSRP